MNKNIIEIINKNQKEEKFTMKTEHASISVNYLLIFFGFLLGFISCLFIIL
jgi:hypothetical protein